MFIFSQSFRSPPCHQINEYCKFVRNFCLDGPLVLRFSKKSLRKCSWANVSPSSSLLTPDNTVVPSFSSTFQGIFCTHKCINNSIFNNLRYENSEWHSTQVTSLLWVQAEGWQHKGCGNGLILVDEAGGPYLELSVHVTKHLQWIAVISARNKVSSGSNGR